MNDIARALPPGDAFGVLGLLEPDAAAHLFIGGETVEHMPDDFAQAARGKIASDRVGRVARYAHDAFEQFCEESVAGKVLREGFLGRLDLTPSRFV